MHRLLAVLAASAMLVPCALHAETLPYQEHAKRLKAAEMAAPLTSQLFGDSVSLYNGTGEFSVVDIDIPGNSGLPVRLGRRFKVATWKNDINRLGGFGAWDMDVPYMSATFLSQYKWNVGFGGYETNRCSSLWTPEELESLFEMRDFWTGTQMHIPGAGTQEVLFMSSYMGNLVPSTGGPWLWGTKEKYRLTCKASTANGYPGEGFIAYAPDGTKYTFDYGIERRAGRLRKYGYFENERTTVYLLATRVEDRHGNWVRYNYVGDGQLSHIDASDGRRIDVTYGSNGIDLATAHGRTWDYDYATTTYGYGYGPGGYGNKALSRVLLPDGSSWQYQFEGTLEPSYPGWDGGSEQDPRCLEGGPAPADEFIFTATHPAGATGVFRFDFVRMRRSGTPEQSCVPIAVNPGGMGTWETYYELRTPDYFDVYALSTKTISGPGLSPMIWQYAYEPINGSGSGRTWNPIPCMTCQQSKLVHVAQPDGSKQTHEFGVLFGYNDGRQLGTWTIAPNGTVLQTTSSQYVTDSEMSSQSFPDQYGTWGGGDDHSQLKIRPVRRNTTVRQGTTFESIINSFDSWARPTSITKVSTLSPSFAKTEITEYEDDLTSGWVLGLLKKVTDGGVVVRENKYYPTSRLLEWTKAHGRLIESYEYNADGTLFTVRDGRSLAPALPTLKLTQWHRGLPQRLDFPTGSPTNYYRTAAINDHGEITQITDELGYSTQYQYDAMGRLQTVTYPAGDTQAWTSKTFTFVPVASAECGIGSGHWRHTVSHGNYRKVTYLDGLWRPVISHEYDSANVVATQKFLGFKHDHENRVTFASSARSSGCSLNSLFEGVATEYDALGRTAKVTQDTEHGKLSVVTDYLAGFLTRVTNARGYATTYGYQAFDAPSTDSPVSVSAPEGQNTFIARDRFGKPLSITRSGTYEGLPVSVTRSYVYDVNQQLCKRIEPESGATIFSYDAAGNVEWTTEGTNLVGASSCDHASVPTSQRVVRQYDALNQPLLVTYPDGVQNLSYTYWPDGLVKTANAVNAATGGTSVASEYDYNRRRLPTKEVRVIDGRRYEVGHGFTAEGIANRLTYPDGVSIDFTPNALGQVTTVGSYVSQAAYWPSGAVKSFTYGNGVLHEQVLNQRDLPSDIRYLKAGNPLANLSLGYDYNGNTTSINDLVPAGNRSRSMTYDDADRLETATAAALWGVESFDYDALDNLRTLIRGAEVRTYNYNTNNQLATVTTPTQTLFTLGYDARGRTTSRNATVLVFDDASRLQSVGTSGGYWYDADGRRAGRADSTGTTYFFYARNGKLLFEHRAEASSATKHHYLGDRLVAKVVDAAVSLNPPTLSVPPTSTNGSYAVTWLAIVGATHYPLEESFNNGAWTQVADPATPGWNASGRPSGSYRYRARTCNNLGCPAAGQGYSGIVTTVVLPAAPTPNATPSQSPNGTYTVTWNASSTATSYQLQENVNGGAWGTVQSSSATSKAFTGKAVATYRYQVRACNASGCGNYSTPELVVEVLPPVPTGLWVYQDAYSCQAAWNASSGATSYKLHDGSQTFDLTVTNWGAGGACAGSYRVAACRGTACSAYSAWVIPEIGGGGGGQTMMQSEPSEGEALGEGE